MTKLCSGFLDTDPHLSNCQCVYIIFITETTSYDGKLTQFLQEIVSLQKCQPY